MSRNMMRRVAFATAVAALCASGGTGFGQSIPGGQGIGRPGISGPSIDTTSQSNPDKPDLTAKKFFTAGMKSLTKAKEYETAAAAASNPDKRDSALEKMGDNYNRALDQFTEALSNKGDMVEAWNNVGYIHLKLGAYTEAVDDFNHTLALKPELQEAVEERGEAYLAVDKLDDAKGAYMDLFNHTRPLADHLMTVMQKWLSDHRSETKGMRASDIEAFDKWVQDRDGIAKQTASLPR